MGERQTDRQTDTERDIERDRNRDRETETERHTERQRQRDTQRDRDTETQRRGANGQTDGTGNAPRQKCACGNWNYYIRVQSCLEVSAP